MEYNQYVGPSDSIFEAFAKESSLPHTLKESSTKKRNILPVYTLSDEEIINALTELDWSFGEDNTTYLSHDIHPYPAKFAPQLPAQIIQLFSSAGETVWDPFGGSGTTALEALLNGRTCISTDINPIGNIIGKAKTTGLHASDEIELEQFINRLEYYSNHSSYLTEYITSHQEELKQQIPPIPNIEKWFDPIVICELSFIKHIIKTELSLDAAITIAQASLSKIVTKVSNQESETTYRAVKKTFVIGETVKAYLRDLKINFKKVKNLSAEIGYISCPFITANVTEPVVGTDKLIKPNAVDLIVTSPPYPNAFDYHLYHRFRIFWLDEDPRKMAKSEIGSHLNYQRTSASFERFEEEMEPVLRNCYQALKAGRYAVFILGNAVFNNVEYQTSERIGALAERIGFRLVVIKERPLPENKRSIKSWARRADSEQILILQKPSSVFNVSLIPVEYRLWPYEQVISSLERKELTGADTDSFSLSADKISALKKLTFYRAYCLNGSDFETWQNTLEQGKSTESQTRKDPKYLTHGIHAYKGKFYPQLVRPLLNILHIPTGRVVFDPFCGSGTVILESILNGYNAYGCDINPIAVEIASAKNKILEVVPHEFEQHISIFRKELLTYKPENYDSVFPRDAIDEIKSWFPQKVIEKMGFILTKINSVPDEKIKQYLKVILSSIIRDISQQDPGDLRIRRRKPPIEDAPVIEMYMDNLDRQYNRIMAFYKIQNLAPEPIGKANIWRGNSTNLDLVRNALPVDGVDIVITSPPYATALPYIDTNRLNMLILNGMDAAKRVPIEAEMTGTREISKATRISYEELISCGNFSNISSPLAKSIIQTIYLQNASSDVGFRRKNMAALIYMYFRDMTSVMHTLDAVVKENGYICIVIGDTKTTTGKETVVIHSAEVLRETASVLGWSLIHNIPISVTTERYVHINNSITENNILIFCKDGQVKKQPQNT